MNANAAQKLQPEEAKPKAGLQLSVTTDGLLRLKVSFPMIDFSRNDAIEIARTMERLAKTLPVVPGGRIITRLAR